MNDEQLLQMHADSIKSIVKERVIKSALTFLGDFGEEAVALGSGTLVSFGSKYGILTCAHTAANLTNKPRIGLGILDKSDVATRVPKIKVALEDVTNSFYAKDSDYGPDLAFIELSGDALAMLKARGVFISIEKHREALTSGQHNPKWMMDFVVGSIEDLNFKKMKNCDTETLNHSLMIVAGCIKSIEPNNQFDLVNFQPAEVDESTIPNGYKGMSGGSLWRFNFEIDKETVRVLSSHLTGVAFRQSDSPNRSITCHGPKSVFQILANELEHQEVK